MSATQTLAGLTSPREIPAQERRAQLRYVLYRQLARERAGGRHTGSRERAARARAGDAPENTARPHRVPTHAPGAKPGARPARPCGARTAAGTAIAALTRQCSVSEVPCPAKGRVSASGRAGEHLGVQGAQSIRAHGASRERGPIRDTQTHLLVVADDRTVFFDLRFCLVELPPTHFF